MGCDCHVMIKPAGAQCNMACSYCFYRSKRALYPETASCRMDDAVLREFTRQYIAMQRGTEMTFAWQGGEPTLMGRDFFARALRYQEEYGRPGLRIANTLQTNGLLLDDAWCEFLGANDFLVGLSLDGPAGLHDACRRTGEGKPSFERVYASLQHLKKHGVAYNVLCTVTSENVTHPDAVYDFFKQEGVRFIQFIPALPGNGREESAWCLPALEWGKFLYAILLEWLKHDVGAVFVMNFEAMLASWCGYEQSVCMHRESCGKSLILEHSGDVYSCDFFVDAEHKLGNILHNQLADLALSSAQTAFGQSKSENLPELCQACPAFFVCRGGCPAYRRRHGEAGEPCLFSLCEGYRYFFEHAHAHMDKIATCIKRGMPVRNIL